MHLNSHSAFNFIKTGFGEYGLGQTQHELRQNRLCLASGYVVFFSTEQLCAVDVGGGLGKACWVTAEVLNGCEP